MCACVHVHVGVCMCECACVNVHGERETCVWKPMVRCFSLAMRYIVSNLMKPASVSLESSLLGDAMCMSLPACCDNYRSTVSALVDLVVRSQTIEEYTEH